MSKSLAHSEENLIMVYIDKFEFATIKKYLALRGPVFCKVVHDDMYPLIKFHEKLKIVNSSNDPKKNDLVAIWDKGQLHFGICLDCSDHAIKVRFIKKKEILEVEKLYFLGRVANKKIPLHFRWNIFSRFIK